MVQKEAQEIALKIYGDVIAIDISNTVKTNWKIVKFTAQQLKETTHDSVYQYVINYCNDMLDN